MLYEVITIVTSHSKDLALPGERIGYLAANPAMDDCALFLEGAVFCNRVLGFVNAPALMQRLVAGLQRESVDVGEYRITSYNVCYTKLLRFLTHNECKAYNYEQVELFLLDGKKCHGN